MPEYDCVNYESSGSLISESDRCKRGYHLDFCTELCDNYKIESTQQNTECVELPES